MKNIVSAVLFSVLLTLTATADARGRRGKPAPDLSGKTPAELIQTLQSGDGQMGAYAVYELINRRDMAAVEPLLAALADAKTHERVRSAVAYSIHQLEDRRAVPVLMTLLPDPKLRYEAMHSLGELKAREAVEPIIDIVLEHIMHGEDHKEDFLDHNSDMVEGTEALGKIGDFTGLRAILPMLGQDEHPYRRQTAVRAVAAIMEVEGTPTELRTELATPLFTHLLDPKNESDSSVRLEAVFGLSHLKALSAEPALRVACETDVDSRVRYAADSALKQMMAPGGPCDPLKPIRPYMDPSPLDQ